MVLSVVLVVAIFWYLLKGIDLGSVWANITAVAVGAGVRLLLGTPAAAARRQPGRAHERTA